MFRQNLSGYQVHQLPVYRRRADVHGHAIMVRGRVTRLHIDDLGLARAAYRAGQCHGHLKILLTENRGNFSNDRQLHFNAMLVIFDTQMVDQTRDIGQVILCIRGRQFQVHLFDGRQKQSLFFEFFQSDLLDGGRAAGSPALQHGGIDDRFHRHAHGHIGVDSRFASQTVPLGAIIGADPFGRLAIGLSRFDDHATFATYPISAARCIDVDTRSHRGTQNGFALGDVDGDIAWKKSNLHVAHGDSLSVGVSVCSNEAFPPICQPATIPNFFSG